MTLVPRRIPSERLAFAPRRFAELGKSALEVRALPSGKPEVKLNVPEPRRVIELADGSLLIAGGLGLQRLATGRKKAEPVPRVTLFARSRLVADRRDPFAFWTLHAFDATLYKYRLPGHEPHARAGEGGSGVPSLTSLFGLPSGSVSGLLAMTDYTALKGADGRGLAAMKDGSFLYTTHKGFVRLFPGGRPMRLEALPGGSVWRLLPAKRLDEFWAALDRGELDRVRISKTPRVVQEIRPSAMIYDVAANDQLIATVQVAQPDGGDRQWKLVVYDYAGSVELSTALPNAAKPPPGENWVEAVTKNRGVVVSRHTPLVAVGGPTWFSVWNAKSGKLLFRTPPSPDGGAR